MTSTPEGLANPGPVSGLTNPHNGLQHARPPCPSPTPGVHPNSIESVMPSNQLILCRPLLLPSILPSMRVFCNESALYIRWPKYWSFSFSICPSNEHSGLVSESVASFFKVIRISLLFTAFPFCARFKKLFLTWRLQRFFTLLPSESVVVFPFCV